MITVNSTVKMIYRNTGTFFGVHVTSNPLDLSYSEITIASGAVSHDKYPSNFRFSFISQFKFSNYLGKMKWVRTGVADQEVLSIEKESENSKRCGDG